MDSSKLCTMTAAILRAAGGVPAVRTPSGSVLVVTGGAAVLLEGYGSTLGLDAPALAAWLESRATESGEFSESYTGAHQAVSASMQSGACCVTGR